MKKLIYSFLFVLCSVFALQAESMVVATYNLRNANAGDSTNGNGWGQRYPYIAQLVQFHGFDIFGTQEGKYHQLQDLKNAMPGYDYIGVGRDDGKQAGEYSAIFYRTGKFEVLDHGDFCLSDSCRFIFRIGSSAGSVCHYYLCYASCGPSYRIGNTASS